MTQPPPTPRPAKTAAPRYPLWMAPAGGRVAQVQALLYQMEMSQWWPPEKLLAHQLRQLQILIGFAARTAPYYKDPLRDLARLGPGALTMDMVRGIPILTRSRIQDAGDALVSRALPRGHGPAKINSTSGSTGQPVVVKVTRVTGMIFQAIGLRNHVWHRRDLTKKDISFISLKKGERIRRSKGWALGVVDGDNVFVDRTQSVSALLDILMEENPDYIQIQPSILREMIQLSVEKGKKPQRLREVRTYAELVDPELRVLCREEWGLPIVDNYSCEELSIMALQCPEHEHLHVQSENVLLEVLDEDGRPCAPGGTGRVVVTALNNFAFPMIRYDIGDYAVAGPPCPCGRGLPVLQQIIGRVRNMAVLPTGEKVAPVLSTGSPMKDLPVRKYQYVQKSVDEIEVRLVVKWPLRRDEEDRIADFLTRGFRHRFNYSFVYMDEIPRLASGKYEVFRCEVKE